MADTFEIPNNKVSVMKRIKTVLQAITIEPVALLMLTSFTLSSMAMQTLILEKACRVDLNLPEEVCDALRSQDSDDNTENEGLVQEYASTFIIYRSILTSVLPCFLLIFVGGWMDLTGRRKVIMFIPILGQILYEINNIINVAFFNQLNVLYLTVTESILLNMFGGWSVLFLAVFSYIADITTEENRTYRLGLVSFGLFIGMPVGALLSGVLLKNYGYYAVFVTGLCMNCVNGFYVVFKLKDPTRTKDHKMHDNQGVLYFMKTFFNPGHFINSLKVVFKKTATNRRTMIIILIATSALVMGPYYGETAIMYLSTRYRFNWDEFQFSMFQALNMITTTIGNMFAILYLSKKLGCHDSVLGILSMVTKMGAGFLYCFAGTGVVFFMGPLIDVLNGTASIAIRSILSKTVENNEISRLNSILSITEVLLPFLFVALFINVYTQSMEVLPGAVFLLGAGLCVPPLIVFTWMFYRHRKSVSKEANITGLE